LSYGRLRPYEERSRESSPVRRRTVMGMRSHAPRGTLSS